MGENKDPTTFSEELANISPSCPSVVLCAHWLSAFIPEGAVLVLPCRYPVENYGLKGANYETVSHLKGSLNILKVLLVF